MLHLLLYLVCFPLKRRCHFHLVLPISIWSWACQWAAVWRVPLGRCIASVLCSNGCHCLLDLRSAFGQSLTLFIEFTVDLILRRVRVDWLWNSDKMLPLLLIKGKQRSAAHLRNDKLASCSVPLSILGSRLTWWQLMCQSLSLFRRVSLLMSGLSPAEERAAHNKVCEPLGLYNKES